MPHPDHEECQGYDQIGEDLACSEALEVWLQDAQEAVVPEGGGGEGGEWDEDQGEYISWHLGFSIERPDYLRNYLIGY